MARATLRFVAAVMITSGTLMIADAGVTIAWQEPISAVIGSREQARLDDQLKDAGRFLAEDRRAVGRSLSALADRYGRRLRVGRAIGRIELPTLDRSYAVVEGTDVPTLRKGPGHFPKTPLPGQRGTVAIAGHRTTYLAPFRTLDDLRPGQPIVVAMPYGRFTYRVERTRIVTPQTTSVIRRVRHDRLVLTACHPLYSAAKRIVVFARLADSRAV